MPRANRLDVLVRAIARIAMQPTLEAVMPSSAPAWPYVLPADSSSNTSCSRRLSWVPGTGLQVMVLPRRAKRSSVRALVAWFTQAHEFEQQFILPVVVSEVMDVLNRRIHASFTGAATTLNHLR